MSDATSIDAYDTAARHLFSHATPWTVDELMELPELDIRIELFDGSLLISPTPGGDHQRAVRNLLHLLYAALPNDWDVLPKANLKLGNSDLYMPDVMVITRPETQITYKPADVALAVEILPPGSMWMGRVFKPQMYAEAGIPWHLQVELEGSDPPEAILYRLQDGGYVEHTRAHAGQALHLTEPVEVSFDPARLLHQRL